MQQEIIAGTPASYFLPSNTTKYSVLQGGHEWKAAESDVWQVVAASGVLSSFVVESSADPGAGESFTFTIRVNGAAPAGGLVVVISGVGTQGLDRTNTVNVAAGDYVDVECVGSAGANAFRTGFFSCIFTGTNPGESLVLGGHETALVAGSQRFTPLQGGCYSFGTLPAHDNQVMPTNGILRRFFVRLSAAPGVNPEGYRFRLNVNGVLPGGTLDCTVTAPATTASDLANSVAVNAGDLVCIQIDPDNAPSATPTFHWGLQFDPTIGGESVNLGGCINVLNNGAIEYLPPFGIWTGWGANELLYRQGGQLPPGAICVLRKFYVWLNAAPGVGTTWNFKLRRNGGDSGLSVDISDLATTGNDLVNSYNPADYDDLTMQADPTVGAPTNTWAFWGIVGYIAPPVGAALSGGVAGKLVAAKII